MIRKEFKCPLCSAIMDEFNKHYCMNETYFSCQSCKRDILIVKRYIATLSSDLDIHNKISKLYYYDNKEIEWIEIDNNKELKVEYKI